MIVKADIIGQPYSGEYSERVYDNENPWNSQSWTFIRFINNDQSEWCGHFRGFPREVAVSKARDMVLILTSDWLYQLDRHTGNLTYSEDKPQYQNLAVAPNGDFILADYYEFEKVTVSIKNKEPIESPIQMDRIKFNDWDHSKLEFTCVEFLNWNRNLIMTYDNETDKIEVKYE